MKNYPEELAALQEEYAQFKERHVNETVALKQRIADLEAGQDAALENRHKIRVTFKSGVSRYYDADLYVYLPSAANPQTIEFRKTNKAAQTYRRISSVAASEIAELRDPVA